MLSIKDGNNHPRAAHACCDCGCDLSRVKTGGCAAARARTRSALAVDDAYGAHHQPRYILLCLCKLVVRC